MRWRNKGSAPGRAAGPAILLPVFFQTGDFRNKEKVNPSSYENYFLKIKIQNNSHSSYLKELYSLAYLRIFKTSLTLEGKIMVRK